MVVAREDMVAALERGLTEVEELAPLIPMPQAPRKTWNARDILAHMAFWEGRAAENLRLIESGRVGEMVTPSSSQETDDWNDRIYRENQGVDWQMALRMWTDLRRRNIQHLQKIDFELLQETKQGIINPGEHYTLAEWIAGDTHEHDKEHLPQLRDLAGTAGDRE